LGKAITLKTNYFEAYSNLGTTLMELGKPDDAEKSLKKAIEHNPEFPEALLSFAILYISINQPEESIKYLKKVIAISPKNLELKAAVTLSILSFLECDFGQASSLLNNASSIIENKSQLLMNEAKYYVYLKRLLSWHDEHNSLRNDDVSPLVHIVGESHALASHGIYIRNLSETVFCKAHWIVGCKQWHLGNNSPNKYKENFERVIQTLPNYSKVMFAIGEIDCRLEEGILKYWKSNPKTSQSALIESTIENYLVYVDKFTAPKSIHVIIQGIPCPNIELNHLEKVDLLTLINLIKEFNAVLFDKSKKMNFEFLDLHNLTDRGDGFSSGVWHIDQHHLKPTGMIEAWRRHFD
jgi:tetratricopeptide (TPR) repeat protein